MYIARKPLELVLSLRASASIWVGPRLTVNVPRARPNVSTGQRNPDRTQRSTEVREVVDSAHHVTK